MIASALSVTGLIAAGVAFVVLYVILSVSLWVSLIAAVGVLAVTALATGGAAAARDDRAGREHRSLS